MGKKLFQKFKLYILFVGLLLSSCTHADDTNSSFFDKELEYQPVDSKIAGTFDYIYNPGVMRIFDQKVFIAENTGTPALHILAIKDDQSIEYSKGVGKEGQGPGEYTRLSDIIAADSLIYVYDRQQLKLEAYDRNGNWQANREIFLKPIDGHPQSLHILSDERFVVNGVFSEDRFQILNKDGDISSRYGELKSIDENNNISPMDNARAWESYSAMQKNQEIIAFFAMNADYIETYTMDGKRVKLIQGSEFPVPKMKVDNSHGMPMLVDDGGIFAYMHVDSDNNHIYALYSGQLKSVLMGITGDIFQALEGNKIHKFDWELNLVGAYKLDHIPYTIAADGRGGVYSTFIGNNDTVEIRYQKLE